MNKVLFVCTGNIYRSPMAAALFMRELEMHDLTDDFTAGSAGTWAPEGRRAASRAIEYMSSIGINITRHRARRISREIIADANVIFTMEKGQKEALRAEYPEFRERVLLLSEIIGKDYDIPDPMSNPDIPIEKIAKQIHDLITGGFSRLLWLADS